MLTVLTPPSQSLKDSGSLESYLSSVKSWLDSNPNEGQSTLTSLHAKSSTPLTCTRPITVISILIVNSDNLPASDYVGPFTDSGVFKSVYTPTTATISVSNWPTLGSMIDSGGRVVVFMDNQADFGSVPWIIDGQ
jgi:hypothetical protein